MNEVKRPAFTSGEIADNSIITPNHSIPEPVSRPAGGAPIVRLRGRLARL